MATIYDIAQLSGTSAATVSYVINGRGDEKRISKKTQEKVLAVAERLNFRPNVTARQLKSTAVQGVRIAAFWPDFYFEQSMVSAMRALKNITALSTDDIEVSIHYFTPDSLQSVWNRFSPAAYDGIVLAGASMNDLAFLAGVDHIVPLVLVNRQNENFPYVSVDHALAGKMACDIARDRGGSSVLSIWDTRYHVATNLRRAAFEARSGELGFSASDFQFNCEGSSDDGYALGISLIQKKLLQSDLLQQ